MTFELRIVQAEDNRRFNSELLALLKIKTLRFDVELPLLRGELATSMQLNHWRAVTK